jgi:hypothetical protein
MTRKSPPFNKRLDMAIAAAKAAGATRVKVNPDGSVEMDLIKPEGEPAGVNDFDTKPPKGPKK